jgi:hypothetical protein
MRLRKGASVCSAASRVVSVLPVFGLSAADIAGDVVEGGHVCNESSSLRGIALGHVVRCGGVDAGSCRKIHDDSNEHPCWLRERVPRVLVLGRRGDSVNTITRISIARDELETDVYI